MGLKGWYAFLRKKGYQPSVLYSSAASTTSSTATRRIDLLSRFSVIRNAYTRNSIEVAHTILELNVMRFGTKENIVIYVDGVQAEEKEFTAQIHREAREKTTKRCKESVDELQRRTDNNLKVRKRHFADAWTSLASSFYWSLPLRDASVKYMQDEGWNIQRCETEANVVIARDCRPDDIVVSADSDMLAYHPCQPCGARFQRT
ncbi:hypothetical protein BC939DRAFT_241313 [Gamsiella multidivaricata]|uniref:uncharacterized protein n=1 Tax=Gamsiella multidivaricata TaxID=101098 RepID=UPI0022200F8C|nr:uncharacterized protein BC939DRAFT_241313 [Gamsiella multidivaricata]KAI7820180.1 hypothetical protein BC939DRAFT_241313 [Gamsiella multidivaricata]